MSVYVSSGAFAGVRDVDELFVACERTGIVAVELASGLRSGKGSLEAALAQRGEEVSFLVHNYFPAPDEPFVLNLADGDEENRERSVRFCGEAIRLCGRLGVPFYSVHAGFVTSLKPEDLGRPERQSEVVNPAEREAAESRFLESVLRLSTIAEENGARLMIENNVDAVAGGEVSHLLLVSGSDIARFFQSGVPGNVGLLLDVAHLRVSSSHWNFDRVKAVETVGPWIGALHLSDNDGQRDTNEPCRQDSWFWKPVEYNSQPNLPTVLEAYRLSDETIKSQVDLITSKLSVAG